MASLPNTTRQWKPGDSVGAGRWPNTATHPDGWQRPYAGVVLAENDPRAYGMDVEPHDCPRPISEYVPVLWDFGSHETHVFWERSAALQPYADDLAAWAAARRQAYTDRDMGMRYAYRSKAGVA